MKHLIALLALTAMILPNVCDAGNRHYFAIGAHVLGDHLLKREVIYKDWSCFRIAKKRIIVSSTGASKITVIKVLEQVRDGKRAEVTLDAGGPGKSWATLTFKSQRCGPIDFIVEIYGKRDGE